MNVRLALSAAIAMLMVFPYASRAQQKGMADNVYIPGQVHWNIPLNLFADTDLQQACADLTAKRMGPAAHAFSAALDKSPENLSAVIGLIQAAPERRNALRQAARKHIEKGGAAADYLAAGLIDFYEWGRLWPGPIFTGREVPGRSALRSSARAYLRKAYDLSHDPVAGFVLYAACDELGGLAPLEDIAERAGGPEFANQYRRAKALSWKMPVPGVPNIPTKRLRVLERALYYIMGPYPAPCAGQRVRTVNGKTTIESYIQMPTPEHNRAAYFLTNWVNKIRTALGIPLFDVDKWQAEAVRCLKEGIRKRHQGQH